MRKNLAKNLRNRYLRIAQFVIIDSMIIFLTYWFGLYHIEEINLFDNPNWGLILAVIIIIKISFLFLFNLYNLILEFVGIMELLKLVASEILSSLFIWLVFHAAESFFELKFSFIFIIFIFPISLLALFLIRGSKRLIHRIHFLLRKNTDYSYKAVKTLIIGAGSGGKLVLDEITKNPLLNNDVVGFVDDDLEKIHKVLNGIPVYGPISTSLELVEHFNIQEVIIAIANIETKQLKEIIEVFSTTTVKIRRLPLMTEISDKQETRIIDVRIEDLLSRGVVDLENEGVNDFIKGKTILVTGGGGSIGSELCNQIIGYNPTTLIIFDIYENTTYDVQLDIKRRIKLENRSVQLIVLIGSVYNETRLEDVFKKYKPNIVFHAAAYKHVPLMEDSAVEAVRTNVLGTYNVAKLSNKYEIEKMVLVSTDKAVRPTNIMGATKSCCERIIQHFASFSKTNYSAVRFGNVLGSNGSVVPLFKKQIAIGGPITVTHKDITRYFMTIPEAVSLILQSALYAEGGEIFILDMGKPVKIYHLVERMIRLSGLVPHVDIKIEEIGLRPGEKLYEELLLDYEHVLKTKNDKIFIEKNNKATTDIESFIKEINDQFELVSNLEVKKLIKKTISEYIIDNRTSH